MTSENFIEKTQDVKNIEKYLYQKSTIIIKSLGTTKMNNFIKQWINEAVIVIFNELEEFLVLFNNGKESLGSLNLFKNPTSKSIDIYMKLNTIFLLILFKNTKSFDNILDWAGVEYDSFKETIFKYFNFSKELKLIYSDCVMFFENEAWKPFTSNLYRNLILLGFGKDSRLLSEDGLEEEMSKIWVEDMNEAPLILKELFKNSYVKFYGYITDYLEKMGRMAREGK